MSLCLCGLFFIYFPPVAQIPVPRSFQACDDSNVVASVTHRAAARRFHGLDHAIDFFRCLRLVTNNALRATIRAFHGAEKFRRAHRRAIAIHANSLGEIKVAFGVLRMATNRWFRHESSLSNKMRARDFSVPRPRCILTPSATAPQRPPPRRDWQPTFPERAGC